MNWDQGLVRKSRLKVTFLTSSPGDEGQFLIGHITLGHELMTG